MIEFFLGFIAFPLLIWFLSSLFGVRGIFGSARNPQEAADKLMPMINSSDELREEIKIRLGV